MVAVRPKQVGLPPAELAAKLAPAKAAIPNTRTARVVNNHRVSTLSFLL